ncbi:superoxide dismutase family protein [Pedobacter yulinensis]|uniref:Superoxide dismutase [Cu-Zn] n=1 Tax=Pedobacter yulinensis TaxID=2126353 RepID=A0A2T3HQY0_9SPHI|nr:superoxide dismutase family protein [Pedobacter yulinensis]PST84826.1 superoxide dismutase family protein [Pedobacter yulinensis]
MKKYLFFALVAAIGLTSCDKEDKELARATLNRTNDGSSVIGVAKFFDAGDGKIRMALRIDFADRADSTVAVHFHEHGDCGNMGENAHGHWNPTKEAHGKWGSGSYHSGDIGNIELDAKGQGEIIVTTDRWSIANGDAKSIIGRGIIVHGGTDDYKTQPTGNSGPRIGCGVIEAIK